MHCPHRDTAFLKVDLHCHSHYSDGKHAANFLIERALANDVTHLAITDHDSTNVHQDLSTHRSLSIIAGVEISCAWENRELHIVGLCIDTCNPQLKKLLDAQQQTRRQRICQIDARLAKTGITGLLPYMSGLVAAAQTRSHVADFLIQQQVCKTRQKVFKQFLNKKGKAWVPAHWCTMEDAIGAITAAGGIPVLAHPGRYGINRSTLSRLADVFKAAGGDALECTYPNIAADMQTYLLKLAVTKGLHVSGGSDFHDASAVWTDVGKFPALPDNAHANGVWHHSKWDDKQA